MTDKLISEMSPEEFESVIDAYIERETQDMGELPAPLFYEALHNIFSSDKTEQYVLRFLSQRNHQTRVAAFH
jgi:hypothetical protein